MDKGTFQNRENWMGSYYQLAIPITRVGEERRLERALHALWTQPQMSGPWHQRSDFPDKISSTTEAEPAYEVLTLPTYRELGCYIALVKEDEYDWLDVCIPVSMLELHFALSYPLATQLPWMQEVDQTFVAIADGIYREVAFDLGIIGEEVSGIPHPNEFSTYYLNNLTYMLSPEFHTTHPVERQGIPLLSGLLWFPPTETRQ